MRMLLLPSPAGGGPPFSRCPHARSEVSGKQQTRGQMGGPSKVLCCCAPRSLSRERLLLREWPVCDHGQPGV